MNYEKTGQLIAARRQSLGLTQLQLAGQLSISNRTVSKWERGAGFPDVSLLEPLADALGLSVIELLHGEEAPVSADSDRQVREAVRIVGDEVKKKLRIIWRVVKICLLAAVLLLFVWHTYEFFATGGDGFDHGMNRANARSACQSFFRTLPNREIFQIEVVSEGRRVTVTDPETVERIQEALCRVKVRGTYRDWGPDYREYTLILHETGQFFGTATKTHTCTFPALSVTDGAETYYFRAVIGGEDAWSVLEPLLF